MKNINLYNKNLLKKEETIFDLSTINSKVIYSYMSIFLVLTTLIASIIFVINNCPINLY
jgi:hypothetical protein